jgi:hypothetical protein
MENILMSRSKKIIIGLLSLLPIVFIIIYFIQFYSLFVEMFDWGAYREQPDPREFMRTFMPLFILILIKVLISVGLLVYFLINAINNKKIDSGERVVWILTFIFVGFIAFPLYWYMRIWNDQSL